LVADFECTTDKDDCRVWAFGISDINSPEYFKYGCTIDEFIDFARHSNNSDFYFHNLEYDGEFILYWLLTHNFKHVEDRQDLIENTFTTLISDTGKFYTMRICFERKNKQINAVNIYDSNKIVTLSVKKIPKAFGLPILKGEIDYDAHNGKHFPPTEEELKYLEHDVKIVAYAMNWFIAQGFSGMTIGANALKDYKNLITTSKFKKWFPPPDFETDYQLRQAYKGGFTWLDSKYKGKDILDPVIVLDVNSLYPDRMHNCKLPFDTGIRFEGKYLHDKAYDLSCRYLPSNLIPVSKGKYLHDKAYDLYFQIFSCQFELKPDYIPMLQIKHNVFSDTEYLHDSGEERPTLCLTSVDLELFFEHYNVYNITWQGGWKFRGSTVLFDQFIDKWMEVKEEATMNGNAGMRTIPKFFMNNIYGKLSTNPSVQSKIPYIENDIVKYKLGEEERREGIHIACGAFITAYARQKTIKSAQKIRTAFAKGESDIDIIYCDTDSLHCVSPRKLLPEGLDIHPSRLGAWKHEGTFERAKFLRRKTYMECELVDDKMYNKMEDREKKAKCYYWKDRRITNHITCAGMPEDCHKYVTWDNFKPGNRFPGKLQTTHVKGGIILRPIDFTIKK
jgi:hypothetical protein